MIICVNELHPEKELLPISTTEDEIATFFNDEQSDNNESSIFVTDEGIDISVNFLHLLNELELIFISGKDNKR